MRNRAFPFAVVSQILLVAGALACTSDLVAQTAKGAAGGHVEVLNAERWEFDKTVAPGAQRLIGDVRFRQDDAFMACDSAWLYDDERVVAFSRVRLSQGDSLLITGDRLAYTGRERTARMSGQVRLSDPTMELETPELSYDVRAHRADYGSGARITGKRDGTVLSSRKGSYFADGRSFLFSNEVRVTGTGWTLDADSLRYRMDPATADFLGPTTIRQDDAILYGERGSYNTITGHGRFTKAARITAEGVLLTGDSLHYARTEGEGTAWGHVAIIDPVNNLAVRGAYGRYHVHTRSSMVTGRAELAMALGADSLFLHGDTLFARQDSLGRKRVAAHRHVRFFKSDLQGVCDSMSYADADSTVRLRGEPFLWSNGHQINGDSMRIRLSNGHAEALHVVGKAFLASQADSSHFNQVTGASITGSFRNDQLVKAVVDGNSRTVYFVREKKDSTEQTTGMNRVDCSGIIVHLDSGKVRAVSFNDRPAAILYPLEAAPVEEMHFEGFRWNAAARPEDREDIFRDE